MAYWLALKSLVNRKNLDLLIATVLLLMMIITGAYDKILYVMDTYRDGWVGWYYFHLICQLGLNALWLVLIVCVMGTKLIERQLSWKHL